MYKKKRHHAGQHKHAKKSGYRLGTQVWVGLLFIVLGLVAVFFIEGQEEKAAVIQENKPVIGEPKEISHGDRNKKQVIFTFDAGSGNQSTDKILEVLSAHGVRGTFFLTGRFIEQYPDSVRKIASAGHEIFNHTYDHPHLPELSGEEIALQFQKMEASLKNILGDGASAKPFFRAPFGDRNKRVLDAAYMEGYQEVYWTVDALDWEESEGVTADEVRDRVLARLAPGNIYLMHMGDSLTGQVLDGLFTTIESDGYKVVSLTQGL